MIADDALDEDREFNELLDRLAAGSRSVLRQIVPRVYAPLRRIAHRQLALERDGHTLDSVALVNEVFLNLVDRKRLVLNDRAHFLAVAAKVMRLILVDHARARNAQKRGDGAVPLPLGDVESMVPAPQNDEDLLALDAALERLAAIDADVVSIVEQRYFGGATEQEIGRALGMSPATVRRRWAFAKAWLHRELREGIERDRSPAP